MNAYMNKNNGIKAMAVFAILAMIVCAFAVAVPAVNADPDETEANPSAPALSTPEEGYTEVKDDFASWGTTPGVSLKYGSQMVPLRETVVIRCTA